MRWPDYGDDVGGSDDGDDGRRACFQPASSRVNELNCNRPLCWRELVWFPNPLAAGLFQSHMGTLSSVSQFS